MRSYYSHLQTTKSIGEEVNAIQKPIFRSSAIFPVVHNGDYSSKVLFLGYWLIKRHIKEIGLLYTLRSAKGVILSRKYLLIDSAKAFTIELSEFHTEIEKKDDPTNFKGSLELEIFSTKDLVFPYPAFVVVYYNEHSSAVVHTVGRIYNDIEDLSVNEEYKVRESGFDIHGGEGVSPFIAFTNGPIKNNTPTVKYSVNTIKGIEQNGAFTLSPLEPFETVFLELNQHINLNELLYGAQGTIKLSHNFEGFFPRFLVGNFDYENKGVSITHSYYDCSELKDDKSYWNRKADDFNDSSVSIPLYVTNGFYTQLAIYPIFSPSDFSLSFDFYDQNGILQGNVKDYTNIKSSEGKYELIDFNEIISSKGFDIASIKSVNILCNWENKSKIPTRIKFGLNVGMYDRSIELPCNICFAPMLGNPNFLQKKGTFRWAPFVNIGKSEIVLTNSAPLIGYSREAVVAVSFYREQDDAKIDRQYTIPANGIVTIRFNEDEELKSFAENGSCWLASSSENPFLNGWYFDFHESGAVAADHIF